MQVERVDFVSVLTQDIARAKEFYTDILGLDRQAERLAVELLGARDVLRQDGDEVDLLDVHYGIEPSGYGA